MALFQIFQLVPGIGWEGDRGFNNGIYYGGNIMNLSSHYRSQI